MFESLRRFFRELLGSGAPPVQEKPLPKPAPKAPEPAARPQAKPAPAKPARVVPKPRGRHLAYAPDLDGDADPGEIVWTWVPYEDDPSQGKDRPVLVVGRDANTLLGLMLSSQSERDGQRHWLALGPGDWDREARPSWVRLDRVVEVDEDGIRREGAILDRQRFDRVAAILRRTYGWP
ncbi:type II toxin-antitoxin system PemK/MazF family toxin [Actinoplanes sp. NPDC023714]|uniref:type II toxin-antitoxin system PemK/MazF family toxin n=1 Tax=Actinoplanes sp. NPDC023714 TaxID=3154322 RepID=UPI00340B4661